MHGFYNEEISIASYGKKMTVNKPLIKPTKSQIEIEELDSNLLSGVRLCPLTQAMSFEHKKYKPSGWPCVFYVNLKQENYTGHNSFNFLIESFTKQDDKLEQSWFPFTTNHIESCELVECYKVETKSNKFQKIVHKFAVKHEDLTTGKKIPHIQFYCDAKFVKYMGGVFKEGDLITVVFKHKEYPLHWPSPPIITVVPTSEQTFIPMLSKQQLLLVVNQNEIVDFKGHINSAITSIDVIDSDFNKQCHFFRCSKPTSSSEIIFIHSHKKKKANKKVVIPFVEKEVRYPIILNPINDSVIYSQNIDGFILRFWKESYHPVSISNGTPIKIAGTSETVQYIERKFEIEKRRPFFHLLKKEFSWVIE